MEATPRKTIHQVKEVMINWKWASDILQWERRMRQLGLPENHPMLEARVALENGHFVTVLEVSPMTTGPRYTRGPPFEMNWWSHE